MTGYNHYLGCKCGWCIGRSRQWSEPKAQVGGEWRRATRPQFVSYVDPNARCPVCGLSVFFYQSPHGGKVFFDELGPPWAKHPCTDNWVSDGTEFIVQPAIRSSFRFSPSQQNMSWRPLIFHKIVELSCADRIYLDNKYVPVASRYIFLPKQIIGDSPAYWRLRPDRLNWIEISHIKFIEKNLTEVIVSTPISAKTEEHYLAMIDEDNCNPDELNKVGWSMSFGLRQDKSDDDWRKSEELDFVEARRYFEIAAASGYWPAINNLGVMSRDGLGADRDPRAAFKFFSSAAQSLEIIPLSHLLDCYREGIGVEVDLEMSALIDELIVQIHENDNN